MLQMMKGLTPEEVLNQMEIKGDISEVQHKEILHRLYSDIDDVLLESTKEGEEEADDEEDETRHLRHSSSTTTTATTSVTPSEEVADDINRYLDGEVDNGDLKRSRANLLKKRLNTIEYMDDPVEYLQATTRSAVADIPFGQTNGITMMSRFHGQLQGEAYGFAGLWGFTNQNGDKFVLQTTLCGMYLIHVREISAGQQPRTNYNLQTLEYFDLDGLDGHSCNRVGLSPFDWRYRDVATYTTPDGSGIYAYIGTQQYGGSGVRENYVMDLSSLNSFTPGAIGINIPDSAIKPIESTDNKITNLDGGHTINAQDGYLFFHAYGSDSKNTPEGCHIYDLLEDPFNPTFVALYKEGQCHDSFMRSGIYVPALNGQRDLLFSADGEDLVFTIVDITDIRTTGEYQIIGRTQPIPNIFAHSVALSDDNRYLFAFEEDNVHDIAIYDLYSLLWDGSLELDKSIWSPPLVTRFQWSGTNRYDTFVHNGWARGNLLYVAHYEVGLRVFDFSDPTTSIREVGYWETLRDPNGTGQFTNRHANQRNTFEGCWNLFMFDGPQGSVDSSLVVVSDTYQGTFLLQDPNVITVDDGGENNDGGEDDGGEDDDGNCTGVFALCTSDEECCEGMICRKIPIGSGEFSDVCWTGGSGGSASVAKGAYTSNGRGGAGGGNRGNRRRRRTQHEGRTRGAQSSLRGINQ